MQTPQTILILLTLVDLLLLARFHGTKRENPNYSFWTTLISYIILFSILIAGGFFR